MNICVYGASSNHIEAEFFRYGEEIGRGIARRGWTMVFGGGANGMMGAAARGAYSEGGRIIGVSPHLFRVDGVLFEHCSEMVYTDTMRDRKKEMEIRSDGFVILPGGIGTFDEFFEILVLRQLGYHAKPIGLLNAKGYYDPMIAMLEASAKAGFMNRDSQKLVLVSNEAEELLERIRQNMGQEPALYKDLK